MKHIIMPMVGVVPILSLMKAMDTAIPILILMKVTDKATLAQLVLLLAVAGSTITRKAVIVRMR